MATETTVKTESPVANAADKAAQLELYEKQQGERLEQFKELATDMEKGRMVSLLKLADVGASYVDAGIAFNGADGFKPTYELLGNTLSFICDESIGASRLLAIWGLGDLLATATSEEQSAETMRKLTPSAVKPLVTLIQRDTTDDTGLSYIWKEALKRDGKEPSAVGAMLVCDAADGMTVADVADAVAKALRPVGTDSGPDESEKSAKRTRTAARRVTQEIVKAVAEGADRSKLAEKLAESDDFPIRDVLMSIKPEKLAEYLPLTAVEAFIKAIATDPKMSKDAKKDTLSRLSSAIKQSVTAAKLVMPVAA